ncbi:MAG: hypothetical protein AAF399_08515, partial [Bacteroidota bacterium]
MTGDQSVDGGSSVRVEMAATGGMIIGHRDNNGEDVTFSVDKDKTYEMGVWVYMIDLGDNHPLGLIPDMRLYWGPDTDWSIGGTPTFSE